MTLDELDVVKQQLRGIGTKWVTYFNTRDLDELLDLYDDNATHYSPRLRRDDNPEGKIVGKSELRRWWGNSFLCFPTLQYNLEAISVDGVESGFENVRETPWKKDAYLVDVKKDVEIKGTIFIKYKRTVSGQPDTYVAEEFKVKHGKIVESRVYLG